MRASAVTAFSSITIIAVVLSSLNRRTEALTATAPAMTVPTATVESIGTTSIMKVDDQRTSATLSSATPIGSVISKVRGPADMHTHSTHSDGSDSAVALVRAAAGMGLSVLAITDHDQIMPIDDPAIKEATTLGVNLLIGTEISTEWTYHYPENSGQTVGKAHLLAYYVMDMDANAVPSPRVKAARAALNRALEDVRRKRDQRNSLIAKTLDQKWGFAVTLDEVLSEAANDNRTPGRPHFAKVLVKKGHALTIADAFNRFLSDEQLELPKWSLDIEEAIKLVHDAGGVSVLAHPASLKLEPEFLKMELIGLLDRAPLSGLEVFSSRHSQSQAQTFGQMAAELGLIATGGSDYHGSFKPNTPLGMFGGTENTAEWKKNSARSIASLERLVARLKKVQNAPIFRDVLLSVIWHAFQYVALFGVLYTLFTASVQSDNAPSTPIMKRFVLWMSGESAFVTPKQKVTDLELGESAVKYSPDKSAHNTVLTVSDFSSRTATTAPKSLAENGQLSSTVAAMTLDSTSPMTNSLIFVTPPASGESSLSSTLSSVVSLSIGSKPVYAQHHKQSKNGGSPGTTSAVTASTASTVITVTDKPIVGGRGGGKHQSTEPADLKLFILAAATLIGLLMIFGYLQERIVTVPYDTHYQFQFSELLVFTNRISALLFATIILKTLQPPQSRHAPAIRYGAAAMSNIGSTWAQYEALKFISFPLQVLSKTAKPLFTMIGGRLLRGVKYSLAEYVSCGLLTIGLLFFSYNEATRMSRSAGGLNHLSTMGGDIRFILLGCFLIFVYIVCDSYTSNFQKVIYDVDKVSEFQMMQGMNATACIIAAALAISHGQFMAGIAFCIDHPLCAVHVIVMSTVSALSQTCIMFINRRFGPMYLTATTTTRQFASSVLSILSFGHAISASGWVGLLFVFVGAFILLKSSKKV